MGTTGGLGACSPMCLNADGLNAHTREACKLSGSIARAYPLGNYGLDVNAKFSLLDPENLILGALQEIAAAVWQIFVHAFNGILLLLEWAFSLDLLGDADVMQRLHEGLTTFHERVLGDSMTLVALSLAALWGIWYGLVRRKTVETLAGLGATIALMILALAIIYRPDATIAPLSKFANQGSLHVLTGISRGSIDNPTQNFANLEQQFTTWGLLHPWCALQFGDVDYCLKQRKDNENAPVRAKRPGELSIADAWLQTAPNDSTRDSLYKKTLSGEEPPPPPKAADYDCKRGGSGRSPGLSMPFPDDGSSPGFDDDTGEPDIWANSEENKRMQQAVIDEAVRQTGRRQFLTWDDLEKACNALKNASANPQHEAASIVWKDPSKVYLQGGGGTFERIALLAIIIIGLIGAILLFGWLAVRLMLAAVFSLMYILMTPVLLLVAALGNVGRDSVVAAGKRGLGQIVAKFIYALLLALVFLEASILASLKLGFYGTWLLQIAFWWGFFLKRHDFLGYLSLDQRSIGGLGLGSEGTAGGRRSPFSFMNMYYGARAARAASRAVMAGPKALVRRGRRAHLESITADSAAIREQARDELALRARREAQQAYEERNAAELAAPRRVLAEQEARRARLADLEREREAKPSDPETMSRRWRIDRRRQHDALGREIEANEGAVNDARAAIRGPDLTERDVDGWIESRRRSVDTFSADDSRNLRAAGILPSDYARAGEAERAKMRKQSERIMERDRQLLSRLGDPRQPAGRDPRPLSRDERREAFRESVPHGTFGDLSQRAREIRRDNAAQARHEYKRRRLERGRRRLR